MPRRRSLPRLTRASATMLVYIIMGGLVLGQFILDRLLVWIHGIWQGMLAWFG